VKVLIVSPYPLLDPVRIRGGVEAAAFYLARGLNTLNDVKVSVLCDTKSVSQFTKCFDNGILVNYIPNPRIRVIPNLLLNVYRLRHEIAKMQPDIVHSHSSWGALAGLRAGLPIVYTIHGVVHREERYLPSGLTNKLSARLLGFLHHKAMASAHCCIAVSKYVKDTYAPIARRIHVIPNAVDDAYFEIVGAPIPGRLLCVEYIGRRKNTLGSVRAVQAVKKTYSNAELVIAGGVRDQRYYKEIAEYIACHGLEKSVHFLGQIDQPRVLREYACADIVCTFSWHETFSLTLAQGMAAGKAVVGSDCGGPADLIVNGETGYLVPPGDEQAFAARCSELLSNRQLLEKMGRRAREVAMERFRKEVVAAQTLSVYNQVLQEFRCAAS